MKVSIIIPVYNVEKYIVKCVESVINQDYKGQMECIIVDDATPDDSITLAENLISDYSGRIEFQVIHHETNKGLSAARNTGIKVSTGDYIYFLDSDDYIEPYCISSMCDIIKKYPNVEIVQAGTNSSWGDFSLIDRNDLPDYIEEREWIKKSFLNRNLFLVTSWNKLIKKSFVVNNKLYFKEGIVHEDEHWNFFACKHLSSFAICKKNTYNYITRDGSIMQENNEKKNIESWLIIMDDFINNIDAFCRKDQIKHIFIRLHHLYVFCNIYEFRCKTRLLLKRLQRQSSWVNKLAISILLNVPYFLNKRKIFYKILLEKVLM